MNIWIKRATILVLVLLISGTVYLANRPKKINVKNMYDVSQVGVIMEDQTGDQDTGVIGFDKYIENDFLSLYIDEDTTHFAVKDKRNDYTWYSSTKKSDPLIKTNSIKDLQRSTFQITYLQKDGTVSTMNNYEYSISYKRDFDNSFNIEYLDNGFKIIYTLSDRDPKGYWFPAYISADRFTELVRNPVQLNGNQTDIRNLNDYYKPMEDDPNTYVITQLVLDEETNEFNMNELSGAQVETLFKLFYDIGYYGNDKDEQGNYIEEYHLDDVTNDNREYGIIVEYSQPEFVIPMEVTLLEDRLDVKINYFEIEERNGFEIVSIKLLPYFGAVRNDTEGYLVIPEGSGGLINFNNGKVNSKSYSSYIYGLDNLEIPEEAKAKDIGARLPIFGLKAPNNSMLAIIDTGVGHSKVTADISEKYDSYNKVYNEFIFRQPGTYRLAENTIQLWSEEDYVFSPKIQYYFFSEEEANYSSMAQLYGTYLSQKFRLEELLSKEYSMYLDILGSYDYDSFFLWFPTNENDALTTYKQAESIIKELKDNGVDNQVIRYLGWFNNGLHHTVPNDIDLDRSLGRKKDFTSFNEFLMSEGIPFFYDVDFVKTYDSGMFYSSRNYARIVGGNISKMYPYSPSSNLPNKLLDPYYLSNLAAIDDNTDGFLKDLVKTNIEGVSLRNLGDMIYSDYKNNALLPREHVEFYYYDILAKFYEYNLMVENANMYALSRASYITDLETRTSQLVVVDQSIPFYQIAIAPFIDYSLHAFNHGDVYEIDNYLLKALETGSSMKAVVSYENTNVLANTEFNDYYSVYYETSKDEIITLFNAFNTLQLDGTYLVSHTVLGNGLVQVTYSDQSTFIINYNDEDILYNDITIESKDYTRIEVE